jgi:hypothetical protein
MKTIWTVLFFLSGIAIIIYVGSRIISRENNTQVEVPNRIVEGGVFSKSSKIEAKGDFVIKNIGNSLLIIHKIETDCNCTSFHLSKDTISPKDSTIVTLIFDKYSFGYFSRFAEVFCNCIFRSC